MSLSKSERTVLAAVRDGLLRKVGASRWFIGDSDAYHVVLRLARRGLISGGGEYAPRLTDKGRAALGGGE